MREGVQRLSRYKTGLRSLHLSKRNCYSTGFTRLKPTMPLARIARLQPPIAAFHKTNPQLLVHVLQRHGLHADDDWSDELATAIDKDLAQLRRYVREWFDSSSHDPMPPATFDAIHKAPTLDFKGIQSLVDNMVQMCHLANRASRGGKAALVRGSVKRSASLSSAVASKRQKYPFGIWWS